MKYSPNIDLTKSKNKRKFGTFCLTLVLLLSVSLVSAQQALSLQIEDIDGQAYPSLAFNITPSNEFGVPQTDLSQDSFTVSDDVGPLEEITIEEFVDDSQPISIMLVLDASGSIVRSGALPTIRDAALGLVQNNGALQPSDELGVLFFNVDENENRVALFPEDDPREIKPTLDGGALTNFINTFDTTDDQAGTPLYDAIYRAVQVSEDTMNPSRRAIIVMTDGIDEGRLDGEPGSLEANQPLVIAEAVQKRIPIFTIGLGEGVNAIDLRLLASSTGGESKIQQAPEDLQVLFQQIAQQLKTKYRITGEARVQPDGKEHTLTVDVQTTIDSSTATAPFTAEYPIEPIIEASYFANNNSLLNENQLQNGVSGTIDLQLELFSRNNVDRVEYVLGEEIIGMATEAPWLLEWRTQDLEPNETYELLINVFTEGNEDVPASSRILQIPVNECTTRCLFAEANTTGLDNNTAFYIFIGLITLILILFIVGIIMIFRRNSNPNAIGGTIELYQASPPTENSYEKPFHTPAVPLSGNSDVNTTATTEPYSDYSGSYDSTSADSGFTTAGAATQIQGTQEPEGYNLNSGYVPVNKTVVLSRNQKPARLAFLFDADVGTQYQLKTPKTTIGRGSTNDIVLSDSSVSTLHVAIIFQDEKFLAQDLAAANQTEVNGSPIVRQDLKDGDVLTIGRDKFIFKDIG